jgi:hypothetical protein
VTKLREASTWNPDFQPGNTIFDDLRHLFRGRLPESWPSLEQLNALLPDGLKTEAGAQIQFAIQRDPLSAADYELSIHRTGQVPTRLGWHDVFNALMWALFPNTKAALNAGHARELARSSGPRRSRRRDALTLVDEVGVILAVSEDHWSDLHRAHDWHSLFIEHRRQWSASIRPYVIGHGLYQQCLMPHIGLTAKAWYVQVDSEWFDAPLHRQYAEVDRVASHRLDSLDTPKSLLPLPVLGVPGWYSSNRDPAFYRNSEYFRPAT